MAYPESLTTIEDIKKFLSKKEFAELKLNRIVLPSPHVNPSFLDESLAKMNHMTLHSHQIFTENFMNPNTPYTRNFTLYGTGLGKTIAVLSAAMKFIKAFKAQYAESSAKLGVFDNSVPTPMIFVIGFSEQIFLKELMRRPEFGFVTEAEITELKRLKYFADNGGQAEKTIHAEYESRIKKRLSKKNRGGFFKFYGYKKFFNRLFIFSSDIAKPDTPVLDEPITEVSEEQILAGLKAGTIKLNLPLVDSFANSFICCDEFHNAYNASEINNYGIALKILFNIYDAPDIMNKITPLDGLTELGTSRLSLLKNSTVRAIFMSATPINNNPTEIIDLLNILIPLNRLPSQKSLRKDDFFIDSRNLKPTALEKIGTLIRGYISYLRDDNPKYFPEKRFKGEDIPIPTSLLPERVNFYKGKVIPYLKFVRCPMSDLHQKTYSQFYNGTLPPDGQSLIDMVLPNPGLIPETKDLGLFRTKDIKYSILTATQKWRDTNMISLEKLPDNVTYYVTGDFMLHENIKKYSTKYATLIALVLKNLQTDGGKMLINHQTVRSSGILFIQELLKRNGVLDEHSGPSGDTLCSRCGAPMRSKHKDHEFTPARFVMYYGDVDKSVLDRSLDKFKSPENSDGYYYRFIIGSKLINEGVDLNAIQSVCITHIPSDYSTILQILGRAIRTNSHIMLPPEKRFVTIMILVTSLFKKDRGG